MFGLQGSHFSVSPNGEEGMKEPGGQDRQAPAPAAVEGGQGMHTVELGAEIVLPVHWRHKLLVPRPRMGETVPTEQGVQVVAFVLGFSKSWKLS